MPQDRIERVAILSIEQVITKQINFDDNFEKLAVDKVCTK